VGPDRLRAEALLRRNRETARSVYEAALRRGRELLDRFELDEAAHALRAAAFPLLSTEYAAELTALADASDLARDFATAFGRRLRGGTGKAPVARWRPKGKPNKLTGADEKIVEFSEGPVVDRVPWRALSAEELVETASLLPVGPGERAGLAAMLVLRGERTRARSELLAAVKGLGDDAFGARAKGLLRQLEQAMKLREFRFDSPEEAMELELTGSWEVDAGKLLHSDMEMGTAAVRELAYRADGLEVAFAVAFLDADGILEVQIGTEADRTVWFSLGSRGYQARASAGGGSMETRGRWAMEPNVEYSVKCRVASDSLAVQVDGRDMPALALAGLGGIEGPVTFRAQVARLTLDDVRLVQHDAAL
jgi:hypothetical protein